MTDALLRIAGAGDAVAIDTFLACYPATSMFLRGNLAQHGTDDRMAPHGTTFYLTEKHRQITAVYGITNQGYLMAQAPGACPASWVAFAERINGQTILGMTGVPAQVEQCLGALGVRAGPWQMFADEPLYHLNIADLKSALVTVRAPVATDLPVLERWFADYAVDVGQAEAGAPPSDATRARAARAVDNPDVALFEQDGVPVAMAGINARLPDIVQIGGVYTPDDMRGRGYAKRALAGLLQHNRSRGVAQSILFSNNDSASRTYEALRYQHIGQYRVALLKAPIRTGDKP